MIPNPTERIRAIHTLLVNDYERSLPSDTKKDLWSQVFRAAKKVARAINKNRWSTLSDYETPDLVTRELDEKDIVNHWYLDIENDCAMAHDYRAHDKVTGFRTISQELQDLEKNENQLAYEIWEREFRKWWFNGKQGTKPKLPAKTRYRIITTEDYDTYGTGAWSEQQDDVEALEYERDQKQGFFQSPSEDPENPLEDDYGCKRLAIRHRNPRREGDEPTFKFYRGSRGVLGGIYTNTDPEPNYRTHEGRMKLLDTLLKSDNELDVKIGFSMIPMKPQKKGESDSDYAIRLAKRRKVIQATINHNKLSNA